MYLAPMRSGNVSPRIGSWRAATPATVAAGTWGALTDRAWGALLPALTGERGGTGEARPAGPRVTPPRNGKLLVGGSMSTGLAHVSVGPADSGKVEVFLDCASGGRFGDGTHVIARRSHVNPLND